MNTRDSVVCFVRDTIVIRNRSLWNEWRVIRQQWQPIGWRIKVEFPRYFRTDFSFVSVAQIGFIMLGNWGLIACKIKLSFVMLCDLKWPVKINRAVATSIVEFVDFTRFEFVNEVKVSTLWMRNFYVTWAADQWGWVKTSKSHSIRPVSYSGRAHAMPNRE